MRGIERFFAAILLAGAVVGAAAFAHLLGRNPDIAVQLGLPKPGQPGIVQAAPLPAGPLQLLPGARSALSGPAASLSVAPALEKLVRLRPGVPAVPRLTLPAPTTTPSAPTAPTPAAPAPTPAPAAPAPAAPAAPAPQPAAPAAPTPSPPPVVPVPPKPVPVPTVPPKPVSPPPPSHPNLPVPPIAAPPAIVVSAPLLGPPGKPTPGPVLPVDTPPDPSVPTKDTPGTDDGGNS